MDDIADRAARVIARHPAPVLPFSEVGRLVRGSGVAVTDDILLRSLARDPARFRIVDPWKGPWRGLAPGRGDRTAGTFDPSAAAAALGGDPSVAPGPWVVPEPGPAPWSPRGNHVALRRLREGIVHLGWALDLRSPRDVARWCRLVLEAGRTRERLTRAARA